ncbi:MAG: dimethyl sulfoxide reductase anchor subunit [Rhodospirillaceae bacterium]|jgi:DMSO reductase anchor subunit|nr:dimethyl sulfoxide reductase anchor subunit [Rhodospirillaceae bacterium]MBT5945589.1 dimethyl sulfoxide reductase anchor subunit [Rhodospirillaceae bacterium]MBT6403815.1 dimethyl sulfoxide reductase anchor subunit [Rhodospirillaceae bacterium]MBT6536170.1 dimethyl sulfoxide reductase anchor subunit [Rhodospirillaceae bacterium]MBT7362553.1 dimethyl sulfoxide reductase anchor subunit [Rhodospirillaceae bacterium]
MNPAYSVIFFTTASGAGYGAIVWLVVLALLGIVPLTPALGASVIIVSLALITAGLLSSTFHLGHPERAWRALSQWRSSWLSREGVAALVTYVPILIFAVGSLFFSAYGPVWIWAGLIAAMLSLVTVGCTGMIYASLRAIPRWSTPLVVPLYIAFAMSTGAVLLIAIASLFWPTPGLIAWCAAVITLAAWMLKIAYWRQIDNAKPVATAESATGLGAIGTVRLLESPHSSENYVMREMGYTIARKHAARLRKIALVVGGVATALALVIAGLLPAPFATAASIVALIFAAMGILIERWLFFAEARHAASLYYGASEV